MRKQNAMVYWFIGIIILLIGAGILTGVKRRVHPNPKPIPKSVKYEYYRIIDEKTKQTLMIISSGPVAKGDELITADNKRYVVVKVKKNVAYARFREKINLQSSVK